MLSRNRAFFFGGLFLGCWACCAATGAGGLTPYSLRCDYVEEPRVLTPERARFSWALRSSARDQAQGAYQVLVADSLAGVEAEAGNCWDSGRVESAASTHVPYAGKALEANRDYFWRVRVWDTDGNVSGYSEAGRFSTGLFPASAWAGCWIGRKEVTPPPAPGYFDSTEGAAAEAAAEAYEGRSTLFRRDFEVAGKVARARLFICGLGCYEAYLNGEKIGGDVLAPPKTQYAKEVLYTAYEVTNLLQGGANALGVMLGNGWFNPYPKWWSWRMQWFGSQRLMAHLAIEYADGSQAVVASDEAWRWTPGPVMKSCIYDGEFYDAREEIPGWHAPGFDAAGWAAAVRVAPPKGRLKAQAMPPIAVVEELRPIGLKEVDPGIWVVDMGQNFAGWPRLTLEGPRGAVVRLRYAENIDTAGRLDRKSMNKAEAQGEYILKGGGKEVYAPHFTYYGFRYVELTGFPGTPTLDAFTGCVVHSACPQAGSFRCGHPLLNRLQQCILWSQRSNMVGYPMDCPQRDERLGWMGDAHVTAEEAMHNFYAPRFYRQWLEGVRIEQDPETGNLPYISPRPMTESDSTAWTSGYLLMIWYAWLHYGDRALLEDHFESMRGYVEYLRSQAEEDLLPPDKYGDWLSLAFNWQRGKPDSVGSAYYYYTADILAKAAAVLGKAEEAAGYRGLAERIAAAYHARFFNEEAGYYDTGSQFSQAFPLFLGIVPDAARPRVIAHLREGILVDAQGHLTTGMLGTKYLMEVLEAVDGTDIAWLLATREGYPGWADLIQNRTTLSERWNQSGSNNHILFGSIGAWFYRNLAGIRADAAAPGFKHLRIEPYIHPELGFAEGQLETLYGPVRSAWKLTGADLELRVSVPPNTTATLRFPAQAPGQIRESGQPLDAVAGIHSVSCSGKEAVIEIGSGDYCFSASGLADLLPEPWAPAPTMQPEKPVLNSQQAHVVRLESDLPDAEIRYTLDGSEPDEQSPRYTEAFRLAENTEVRAKAFAPGHRPSLTTRRSYTFIDPEKNGLRYALYKGAFTQLPDFTALTPDATGSVEQCGLKGIDAPEENYALQFTGQLRIDTPGEYRFLLLSNDGSRLYLNDALVIDNDGEHTAYEKSGTVRLAAGLHPLRVEYFQSGGGAMLLLAWESAGQKKQRIPASAFFKAE